MLLKIITAEIQEARNDAHKEALLSCDYTKSRGIWLRARYNDQALNKAEETLISKNVPKKELITSFIEAHKDIATEIYIEGGFNGADNLSSLYTLENYTPWISEWYLKIWDNKTGYRKFN